MKDTITTDVHFLKGGSKSRKTLNIRIWADNSYKGQDFMQWVLTMTGEAFCYVAMIRIMLRRLADAS